MWKKPYTYKEGFAIGAGLIVAGLALQLSVGSIVWDLFAAPVNYITLDSLCTLVVVFYVLRSRIYLIRFLMTRQAAIPTLVFATLLTAMMGFIGQKSGMPPIEKGFHLDYMLSFWPFVLIYLLMAIIVGLVSIKGIVHQVQRRGEWREIPTLLCHVGLFIALTVGTLGSADMQRFKMICSVGEPEWRVVDKTGQIRELNVAIELKKFVMETFENGMPKRFASEVEIYNTDGKSYKATVEVNSPISVSGWNIYQYGYDTAAGSQSRISILELIRDPWLTVVYLGIYMLLVGAVLMIFVTRKNNLTTTSIQK